LNLLGRIGFFFTLCLCTGTIAGCAGIFGGSNVSCDELSSSEWKSLANGERKDEAYAIKECGTLDAMTKTEVESWMGKPIESSVNIENKNKIDSWLTGSSSENSDLPMISVEYGQDGKVTTVRIYEG
jgi:hypothetical protein